MGKLSVWTRGPRAGVECSGKRGRPGGDAPGRTVAGSAAGGPADGEIVLGAGVSCKL